jgi:hypothetical protein
MFQLWIAKCVGLMFTSASQLKSIYRACRLSVTVSPIWSSLCCVCKN